MSISVQGVGLKKALVELPEKARSRDSGLWSFLTRAIIVSQFVAAEHFVGSSASAATEGDPSFLSRNGDIQSGLQIGSRPTADVSDAGAGEGGTGLARHLQEAGPATATLAPYVPSHYANIDKFGTHGGTDYHGASSGGTLFAAQEDAPSILDGGDLPSSIVDLDDVLHGIGNTVTDLVDALPLGSLSTVVDTLLTDVVHPVVSGVVQPLTSEVVSPLVAYVDSLVAELTAGPVATLGDAVASAGQIVFDTVPMVGPVLDTLFSNGRYTDYNLALRSSGDGADAANPGGPMGAVSSLAEMLIAGDQDHHQSDGHQQIITLPSAIEEITHRGIGDIAT